MNALSQSRYRVLANRFRTIVQTLFVCPVHAHAFCVYECVVCVHVRVYAIVSMCCELENGDFNCGARSNEHLLIRQINIFISINNRFSVFRQQTEINSFRNRNEREKKTFIAIMRTFCALHIFTSIYDYFSFKLNLISHCGW